MFCLRKGVMGMFNHIRVVYNLSFFKSLLEDVNVGVVFQIHASKSIVINQIINEFNL